MTNITADIPQLNTKQSTKFYLLILFGDYIRPRGGSIWMSDLIHLLELLNVGEHTGRSTINRMLRDGWFTVEKDGRRSRFSLTPSAIQILSSGDFRLYDRPIEHWDGVWHMIAYSLPEEKRKVRNDLRKQLTWLGYGSLSPGLWISPNNRKEELEQMLETLDLKELVHIFSSMYEGPSSSEKLIEQSWDLDAIAADFVVFNKIVQEKLKILESQIKPSPERCFVEHFMLTAQLFPILQKDPNFPH
ncbi:MAG: hypothetical protein AAGD96_18750, partial [Chloroflexota bacterium]